MNTGHRRTCAATATWIVLIGVMLLAMPAVDAVAEERKAYPVDEAGSDPSFADYRAALLDAVVRRDVDFVVAQASPDIHLSFGGHSGRGDFRDLLTLSEDDLSDEFRHEAAERREDYWDSLEEVLRMGGRFTREGVFEAPYTWTVPLLEDDDSFTTYFAVGSDIAVRDRPSRFGNVVAALDHDIVTAAGPAEGTRFVEIEIADGTKGFVAEVDVRSAVDFRAIFEKRGGDWQMTVFIAGD